MDTPTPATPPSTLTSVGTMLATKGLSVLAGIAVTHGLMTSSNTETFISAGLLLVSLGWSGYVEYGRPILLAQLEVLKAKSLAQAAALKAANVPKVTVSQIAAQSPTMGPAEVVKAIATLPPEIKENVAGGAAWGASAAGLGSSKAVMALAIGIAALGLGWPGTAHAQTPRVAPRAEAAPAPSLPRPPLCDPLNLLPGCHVEVSGEAGGKTGTQPVELDIWHKITSAALPDLDYASASAVAAGTPASGVRKQCWDALILVNKQAAGTGVKNADGTVMTKPDPHLFTDVESLAEVLDNLAPGGPLWVACSGAAQLAKTNVLTFINAVITGATGLAALGVT